MISSLGGGSKNRKVFLDVFGPFYLESSVGQSKRREMLECLMTLICLLIGFALQPTGCFLIGFPFWMILSSLIGWVVICDFVVSLGWLLVCFLVC